MGARRLAQALLRQCVRLCPVTSRLRLAVIVAAGNRTSFIARSRGFVNVAVRVGLAAVNVGGVLDGALGVAWRVRQR